MFAEFLKYLSATCGRAPRLHRVLGDYTIHKAHVVTRYLAALNGRIVLHFLPPYPRAPRRQRHQGIVEADAGSRHLKSPPKTLRFARQGSVGFPTRVQPLKL